ncbi:MAG: DUF342 domain-containing protein [Lachnospiraceae bacterium]
MEKVRMQLANSGFTSDQIAEIEAGAQAGLDVSVYADKELLAVQMRQLRLGLQEGLDVSVYSDRAYDWFQMEEIRKGLEDGIRVELYACPKLPYDKMQQLRLALCDGIDLSPFQHLEAGILKQLRLALLHHVRIISYITEGYDMEQLEAIREALEKKVNITPYLDKNLRGICIREICLGLEHELDVSVYANPCYYWQQMRELRYGMEHMVDVEKYKNPYYSYEQMREIRLGLEAGLDVSYFDSLMYTAADMKQRRLELQEHPGLAVCGEAVQLAESDGPETVRITLAEENTAAYVDFCGETKENLRIEILKALYGKGITYGIRYDVIDRMQEGGESLVHVLVASGFLPEDGKDGYYEYFFRRHVARTPKMLEGGSVDYRSVEWFELVKKGQKLAYYHSATNGKNGMTVTGQEIPARKGREQCILTGSGFHRLEDGKTYLANLDGIISLTENYVGTDMPLEIQMNVTDLLTMEEVTLATGDVHFEGNVFVKGNVGSGARISATGDVLVGGFVEAASITAGGSIMIRQGMNASGEGEICASGDVNGYFFEAVKIRAGGNIHGDYFLNCDLHAQGKVNATGRKGSLVGGSTCAEKGLRAKNLGNQAGLATYVRLGMSERLCRQEQEWNEAIRNVTTELDTLNHVHDEFMNKYPPHVRNAMEMFMKVQTAVYTKEQELDEYRKKKQSLEEEKRKAAFVCAIVDDRLYEGVTFEIERVRWISQRREGALIKKIENQIVVYSNRKAEETVRRR